MLFNLHVLEFEHLKAIWESSLSCLGFSKIIYDLWIWEGLFDIVIVEVDNCIAVWECFSSYPIAEDDFFLATKVSSLHLTIIAYDLVLHCCLFWIISIVIFTWELHLIIFLFFMIWSRFLRLIVSLHIILIVECLTISSTNFIAW